MTEQNLITLINEVGLNTVIKYSLGEKFPWTSLEVIKIFNEYKHKENETQEI